MEAVQPAGQPAELYIIIGSIIIRWFQIIRGSGYVAQGGRADALSVLR